MCTNYNFSGYIESGDGKIREDGLAKTPGECVDVFIKVLKREDVNLHKNTFLRNAGLATGLSKSKLNIEVMDPG